MLASPGDLVGETLSHYRILDKLGSFPLRRSSRARRSSWNAPKSSAEACENRNTTQPASTPRTMEEAVAALLTQRNIEEAARATGVSTATLMRWQKLPEFQAAYLEARRAAFGQAVARLQQGASAAATTLLKTMIDPATPASVRVRAAECVMNQATKAIEIEDIEARVAALEKETQVAE